MKKKTNGWCILTSLFLFLCFVAMSGVAGQQCTAGDDCYQLAHVQRRSTYPVVAPRPPASRASPTVLPSRPDSQQHQPFLLVDMVIVITLDGSIRAIGRYDSLTYWTIGGSSGTRTESSLVKSNIHFASLLTVGQTRMETYSQFMDNLDDDHHPSEDVPFRNLPETDKALSYWTNPQQYGIAYIVEPTDGGILYKYTDGEHLRKLPFTMKDIVDRPVFDEDLVYIGNKTTVVFALDPRYGRVLRKFNIQDSVEELLMGRQHQLPPHTIYIGRNEYNVRINDYKNNMFWQLSYSEYEPNAMNWHQPIDMGSSDTYIAPDATPAITAINRTTGNPMWNKDLPCPAVAVYDVYSSPDFAIILSKQNAPTHLDRGELGMLLQSRQLYYDGPSAYVGTYDGVLYAMSAKNYPLVQLAEWSFKYTGRFPGDIGRWSIDATENEDDDDDHWCASAYKGDCIRGLHLLYRAPVPTTMTNSNAPSTDPPDEHESYQPSPTDSYKHLDLHREGFFYDGPGRFWKLFLLILLGTWYVNRERCRLFYTTRVLPRWNRYIQHTSASHRASTSGAGKRSKKKPHASPSPTPTSSASLASHQEHLDTPTNNDDTPPISSAEEKDTKPLPALPTQPANGLAPSSPSMPNLTTDSSLTTTIATSSDGLLQQADAGAPETRGLDLRRFQTKPSTILELSESVLGYGSHGTVVYKGKFDGRAVAVKRLLIDFYDVAYQEVKLLQESDDHPNVIRYFYKEETDRFLYIALELCLGSLQDCVERALPMNEMKLVDQMDPADILRQMTMGIQHLHSLKIVHRDLKPQNILLAPSKTKTAKALRILISDFGLCKKLDGEQSSFHYTAASPAGTSGWRAPELLAGALAATGTSSASESSSSALVSAGDDPNRIGRVKATRAIDIFSAGCIYYFVLTSGDHPFGNRFGRESNILSNSSDLSKLESMGEDGMEAKDLIQSMLNASPKSRPTADRVLAHPFFWTPAKRLAFLQDASDRFEVETRDPPSDLLVTLESEAKAIIGYDWYRRIDRVVANDLGKFRKYDGRRVRDLLRALRNKKHHWQDLPENVKRTFGEPPDQYLYYFTARFPRLLLHTYHIIASHDDLMHDGALRQYF
ncbi:hypothetical protein DM01DRAFT_1100096 [Hesseltinella vesiculosa]|uniref:non-specific serine/threonine protein kinase n=1 Tax=Hesseltinella vesiculosa TaxID=101127 RepID=A0A1X2GC54_9FUNG|nr:hypothetical protein DM01DRAFT_1100096 [Hesseltinella vesiculosa]